jgi:hypothetical protein
MPKPSIGGPISERKRQESGEAIGGDRIARHCDERCRRPEAFVLFHLTRLTDGQLR